MNSLELKKSLLSPPGETIQEHIDSVGMSQAELAERLGRSIPKLNELIKGKAPITKETASRLEYVLGIPAGFWLNLEKIYQEELLEIEQIETLESYKSWVKGFPVAVLKKLGLVPDTKDERLIAEALLKFFRVASPTEWSLIYEGSSLAFKIALKHTTDPKAISAWLRLGEIQAEQIVLAPFDKKTLSGALTVINDIILTQPSNWMNKLQEVCASFGVALVYSPCISKAPIYGAARWIKNKTVPLIQITDRHKDYNSFWFSFFHELAHIRYHNKSDIFIDGLDEIKQDTDKEAEADDFASRQLIPDAIRSKMSKVEDWPVPELKNFAAKNRIHISILISQLQRNEALTYNNFTVNRLKSKVVFDEVVIS